MIIRFGPEEVENPQCYIENNGVALQHQYGTQEITLKTNSGSLKITTRELMGLQDGCKEAIRELGKYYNTKASSQIQGVIFSD